jgi:two-component system cell cycle sensor histidine kinase/response regulator CckA
MEDKRTHKNAKRTEDSIKASYDELNQIFNSAAPGIRVVDKDFNLVRVNDTFWNLSGISPDEGVGKKCYEVLSGPRCHTLNCPLVRILSGEKCVECDVEMTRDDGAKIHCCIAATPFVGSNGTPIGIIETINDITDRKRIEEEEKRRATQMQHVHRMESIGTLAGKVAHRFNNLLMGIQGYASLILMDIDSSNPHFGELKGITELVRKGAGFTQQLLDLAVAGKYGVKPTSLNELIEKTLEVFSLTGKNIKIYTEYEKEIWPVEVNRRQIQQALANLYVNAREAMPGGGNLFIKTNNVTLDENDAKVFNVTQGNYIKLSITDTGIGMDEVTRQRIFEPFFTAKDRGKMGLGLAVAYNIIKCHGGAIEVDSEQGVGTTFYLYLPASEKEAIKEEKTSDQLRRGNETILLIDDDERVIWVAEQLLKTLGYRTLLAKSGKEGIEVYKKNKDKIDMVILDMIMPEMDGRETYGRIKEINPDVKVLIASGYSMDKHITELLDRGCNDFIPKPFRIKSLSDKLREILDEE